MTKTVLFTIAMLGFSLPALAAPYSCIIKKDGQKVAEINSADMVESADGHQFSYKKSTQGLEFSVYRDSHKPLQYTALTITDPSNSVSVQASAEDMVYTKGNVKITLICMEDLF